LVLRISSPTRQRQAKLYSDLICGGLAVEYFE
jgi:hypothetical protein